MKRWHPAVVREYLRTSLWAFPLLGMLAATALALGLVRLDHALEASARAWYLFEGSADSARQLLSTIATALTALTSVVFSVTVLVLQLASTQYSSRVLRTFLEDRSTQLTLSMFVAGVTYAIVVLPHVRGPGVAPQTAFVPALSIYVGTLMVPACLVVFVRYIHHIAQSIRVVHILARVGADTRREIERRCPELATSTDAEGGTAAPPALPRDAVVVHDDQAGVLVNVDEGALLRLATDHELVLSVVPSVGDFVPRGGALLEVWGTGRVPVDALRAALGIGLERTPQQDAAFGFRQLVDIAERALSPSVNDPTSAVQAIDQLHDLLRTLARRRFPPRMRRDARGVVRLHLPRAGWDDYVRLALEEPRRYGRGSVQVVRRLRALLEDLIGIAPVERRLVLEEELALLDADVRAAFGPSERRLASGADMKGVG